MVLVYNPSQKEHVTNPKNISALSLQKKALHAIEIRPLNLQRLDSKHLKPQFNQANEFPFNVNECCLNH